MRFPTKEEFLDQFIKGYMESHEEDFINLDEVEAQRKLAEAEGWALGYWYGIYGCKSFRPLIKSKNTEIK